MSLQKTTHLDCSLVSILSYLLEAWIIGIAIAAPVGPIGLLCIRKTLENGYRGTLSVGLGAAFADCVFGAIAALGLSVVSDYLLEKEIFLRLFGGIFLFYIAYKEFKSTNQNAAVIKSKSAFRLSFEVFLLTLSNPMTILSFLGIFATISSGPTTIAQGLLMVAGVFLGSMSWWFILGTAINKVKDKVPEIWFERIKLISAVILAAFGVFAVVSGLISLIF